jgi:hypothetical protein
MAQPGGSGVVGPFPDGIDTDDAREEYDKLRRRLLWKVPSGLYVIGSTDKAERRNGMTLNWLTQISFDPKTGGHRRREHRGDARVDRGEQRVQRELHRP